MRHLIVCTLIVAPLLSSCGSLTLNPFDVDAPRRVPMITLKTPSAPSSLADVEFNIQVEFSNVVLDDTWSLYAVSDAFRTKGLAIVERIPVTVRTLRWNTSAIPSGNYYLYGELNSLGGIITASAPGSILIDHPVVAGNNSPIVTLNVPNGGEIYEPGDVVPVAFTATDADSDTLTYDLEISTDGGNIWTELVSDIATTSYDWTIPTSQTPGLTYRVRVRAEDTKAATSSDMSNSTFSIQ